MTVETANGRLDSDGRKKDNAYPFTIEEYLLRTPSIKGVRIDRKQQITVILPSSSLATDNLIKTDPL